MKDVGVSKTAVGANPKNGQPICNLNAYDGIIPRADMDDILSEKNISQQNYEAVDFVDMAADYFKSSIQARALRDDIDLYLSGFFWNKC
ncbi:unnamed protein product [Brachionus calyciflorus]|uniref:Uncharacterized protein n=1 Tax=Brachionus calyciflorus TaxID=104777 RepID=A0A813T5N5_9BILA|nr:unnamed protein product [Brachionus calyciflorus]